MKVNVVIHIANCICLACSHLTAIHLRRPDLGINLVNILLSLGKETKKPHGDLFSKLATSTCLCSFRNQWVYLLELAVANVGNVYTFVILICHLNSML